MLNAILVGLGTLPSPLGWHKHGPHSPHGHPTPIADSATDPDGASNLPASLQNAIQAGKPQTFATPVNLGKTHSIGTGPSAASLAAKDDPVSRKVRKAAQEFESQLISSWWESMKDSGLPGGEDELDPGQGTLNNLASHAMSSVIAAQGGFGLSDFMVSHLQQQAGAQAASTTKR